MIRASIENPSHPPQEAWEGLPVQVLWTEGAQPIARPWVSLLIGALLGAVVAGVLIVKG